MARINLDQMRHQSDRLGLIESEFVHSYRAGSPCRKKRAADMSPTEGGQGSEFEADFGIMFACADCAMPARNQRRYI